MKNNKNDTSSNFTFFGFFYFFWGFILLILGADIEKFLDNLSYLQELGLTAVTTGLIFLSFVWFIQTDKKYLVSKYSYLATSITLSLYSLSKITNTLSLYSLSKITNEGASIQNIMSFIEKFLPIFMAYSFYTISMKLYGDLMRYLRQLNESIEDPLAKTNVLIAFFGLLIALLTLLT